MIVADSNLILYLLLESKQTSQAEAVWVKDSDWCAPTLWRSEVRNVLTLYVRKELLTLAQALDRMEAAESLIQATYEVPSDAVLAQAQASGCSAYDCEFAVLAQMLDLTLVTADRQLYRAFPGLATDLASFIA